MRRFRGARGDLIILLAGLLLALASWAPVWIVEAMDPYAMPVGLGVLALAGSFVGGVIAITGLVRLILGWARA